MERRDIELCLCSNDPIFVDGVPVYPISLAEIAKIGYTEFNVGMRFLCLTASEISVMSKKNVSNEEVYNYLVSCLIEKPELQNVFEYLLYLVTHERMLFSRKKFSFSCGAFEINRKNFASIQEVIRLRNGLQNIDEEEENPDNEAARRVLQRRKEERLKRRKAKQSDEESDITIADLISIMANALGMTMHQVMQYDLYQFNDQFNRLKIMDNYEVSIQALLHGAKKEDVNLTHWITRIKRDDD